MEPRKDIIGSHIGQYRLVKKIGSGGMGTVYLGEHILLGRRAAIKVLQPVLSVQPEIVERFFREAKATSAITDAGVVQIFDFGYHVDGTAYIVMELLQGEPLAERISRLVRLPAAESLRIARQLAGALAAAHGNHIVHRDLKPENVFLVADPESPSGERVKLLDFGICKMAGDTTQTQTGRMLGTPVYMSPEQCQGARDVDGRADIYSLGCLLFHALTGRVPFDLDGTGDLIIAHMQTPAPKPSEFSPELSELVDEIVEHCLAKNPDERFQTMAALQAAIDNVLPKLTPAPARDLPATMALGEGFKSNYNGNFASEKSIPKDWYVSEAPTPMLTGELGRHTRGGTRSLAAILVSALVVALIVAMVMQTHRTFTDEEQLAGVISALSTEKEITMPEPTPTSEPAKRPPAEEPAAGPEIKRPEPPQPEIEKQELPQPEIEKQETPKPDVTEPEVAKPEAPKPTTQTRATSQRSQPAPQRSHPASQKPQPAEDLYDTR